MCIRDRYWVAADGSRSVDLNALAAGSISQTLATVVGTTYAVSFALAGNPDNNANDTVKVALVDAGGPVDNFVFNTTGQSSPNIVWSTASFEFTASATSTTLTFSGDPADNEYGAAIDNVSIAAVPSPAAAGGGMAMLAMTVLRRRRSA